MKTKLNNTNSYRKDSWKSAVKRTSSSTAEGSELTEFHCNATGQKVRECSIWKASSKREEGIKKFLLFFLCIWIYSPLNWKLTHSLFSGIGSPRNNPHVATHHHKDTTRPRHSLIQSLLAKFLSSIHPICEFVCVCTVLSSAYYVLHSDINQIRYQFSRSHVLLRLFMRLG